MKAAKRIVAAALGGTLCLAAGAGLSAADPTAFLSMKPGMAASFDVSAKRLVGYFLNAGGVCKLTLMMADIADIESALPSERTARLQLSVDPGQAARFDTASGQALKFACADKAASMDVTKIDRVAAAPRGH